MTELGDEVRRVHEEVGRLAARAGVAGLIVGRRRAPRRSSPGPRRDGLVGRDRCTCPTGGRGGRAAGAAAPRRRGAGQGVPLGRRWRTWRGPHRRAARRRSGSRHRGGPRCENRSSSRQACRLILALFGTPLAIKLLRRRGYGQLIREEGPRAHLTKRGTPTMGGAVIVVATLIGYLVGHAGHRRAASPAPACWCWC